MVLGEIASRALSPAVNDPGTAIDVIGTAVRLLTQWRRLAEREDDGGGRRPTAGAGRLCDVLEDVFRPIATDGASSFSVALRLQKAFGALYAEASAAPGLREALLAAAAEAAERAGNGLEAEVDKDRGPRRPSRDHRHVRAGAGGEVQVKPIRRSRRDGGGPSWPPCASIIFSIFGPPVIMKRHSSTAAGTSRTRFSQVV